MNKTGLKQLSKSEIIESSLKQNAESTPKSYQSITHTVRQSDKLITE